MGKPYFSGRVLSLACGHDQKRLSVSLAIVTAAAAIGAVTSPAPAHAACKNHDPDTAATEALSHVRISRERAMEQEPG